jgi:hypothetical protein
LICKCTMHKLPVRPQRDEHPDDNVVMVNYLPFLLRYKRR